MAQPTTDPVRLPPGPTLPRIVQGAAMLIDRPRALDYARRRHGPVFSASLPLFGDTVILSDPDLIKEVFTAGDLVETITNLGDVIGPGSTFSLNGAPHLARRKLLVPPLHGKRMQEYENIIEEEVRRELSSWPEATPFATLPSMMRITLNAILRAVFGAEGPELAALRELLPPAVLLASRLTVMPAALRRDYGRWTPWGRLERMRRECDELIGTLIRRARTSPDLDERTDVLAMLVAARDDTGRPIPDDHLIDELQTLLAAGHETTATTLAWAVERLRRHPDVLAELVAEVDAGGSDLLQATVWEVQRSRPVIPGVLRVTTRRTRLGEWVLPAGHSVIASIALSHASPDNYAEPRRFDPTRFLDAKPDTSTWIPYGGGVRRCVGAAFANTEMLITLREMLRTFTLEPTSEPDERPRSRGIANAPAAGAIAVVHRRGDEHGR
ncbi:cytochrome P450 [Mycolicibacterium arabiense]|uniref:Cytochrome P450 n=1 Tax=Mycolicibacterium arabiense TaxID=1286181 RepID=A0A7I7RZA3_9MYCO|nr:cytochrome P450 [Mycolicibacterium arabiense]MCV7371278.1 cytochrome P450 [Mycolicibacterium arabiense]BBY49978.1 cytochrome P450 [Mycolicibacterium arabiense]